MASAIQVAQVPLEHKWHKGQWNQCITFNCIHVKCITKKENHDFWKIVTLSLVLQSPMSPMQVFILGKTTKKISGMITNVFSENDGQLHPEDITNIPLVIYATFIQQYIELRLQPFAYILPLSNSANDSGNVNCKCCYVGNS